MVYIFFILVEDCDLYGRLDSIDREFFNWFVICYNCYVWVDENGN